MFTGGFEDMTWRPRRLVVGLIVLLLLACVSGYFTISNSIRYATSPEQFALERVERILQVAPGRPPGSGVSSSSPLDEGCWQFLRGALEQSDGQYTLTWQSLVEEYPRERRYADAVRVEVTFANGQQAAFVWYQGAVQHCTYGEAEAAGPSSLIAANDRRETREL